MRRRIPLLVLALAWTGAPVQAQDRRAMDYADLSAMRRLARSWCRRTAPGSCTR